MKGQIVILSVVVWEFWFFLTLLWSIIHIILYFICIKVEVWIFYGPLDLKGIWPITHVRHVIYRLCLWFLRHFFRNSYFPICVSCLWVIMSRRSILFRSYHLKFGDLQLYMKFVMSLIIYNVWYVLCVIAGCSL